MALNEGPPSAHAIQWTILLLVLASSASSQTTTSALAAAKECNNACDSQYTSAYTTALQTTSIATFLLNRGSDTKRAADDACRLLAGVSLCYQACDGRFPNNPSSTVSSKASEALALNLQFCRTPDDGTYCRLMDSYYCEALYNKRICGVSLNNFKNCVVDTQLRSNNCSLNDAATWSQRNVKWYIATAVQYCAVSTKAVGDAIRDLQSRDEARKLQTCPNIVTKVCFGDFTSSGTQSSFADRYLTTDISCSVFSKAELCLWRTLNGTILYNGQNYSAACTNLPDNITAIISLTNELWKLAPKKCLPQTTTTVPRSEVTAQQNNPAAAAAACYTSCEIKWSAVRNATSSNLRLLTQYQNSTQRATDYYCSLIANVSTCFSACKETYTQFLYQDKTYALTTVTAISSKCFTDEAHCRIQDSELWCHAYNLLSCGDIANSYGDCYIGVQALRGCHLTNPTQKSQRMVLAKLLDQVLYCINDFDYFALGQDGDNAQTCAQYIPAVCLASITDPLTGAYNPYYSGNATCSDIESIKDCISATMTQTITIEGRDYTMVCQSIPNSAALFSKLLSAVNSLLSCSQTTSANRLTSVTHPNTGGIVGQVSTTTTRQNSTASQALYASTILSTAASKKVTVGMTKQSATKSLALYFLNIHSSGLPTGSSLANVLLCASIAVILNVLGFFYC